MSYINNRRLHKVYISLLIIVLIALVLISTSLGTVNIPVSNVAKILLSKIKLIGEEVDISDIKKSDVFIILNLRLPRIILAGLVGAILSLVGASYQAIFKNPMAEPYVMGVSSGAAFGATIGIILRLNTGYWGFGFVSILAFAGALVTTIIVYNLARNGNRISTTSILLAGIVMSSLLSSIISLMMIFNHDELGNIISWTLGSFNGANWKQIIVILIPSIIGLIVLTSLSREMNAIVVGEEDAQNIGINVERTKKLILVVSSFLAACAVSVSGIIGFVGLIVPHLFRLIFGADHRILLPVTLVGGAIFLVTCDTIARTALEGAEIPVGIITSIFGGPFFLYLLKKSKSKKLV
ncbi:FecCD family ABC transporter permease [Caldisalinibacter kiritimatiensis]|uniref:Vitamin B12 ABC transporter, permease component BtuC n=1 Tax=Caldisalinibacter kiritimatiensis TaxID=1304284 RepID=R1AVP8_9FIRM|nr:iron chelate uptake ABC transporter family permease subunit [Caldisalinibacter kiritimatiensis]EOD00742.1 Vitamin B12 ABC transporter, permease component BtuC [Caldisalinibacter kiritimatiensis]